MRDGGWWGWWWWWWKGRGEIGAGIRLRAYCGSSEAAWRDRGRRTSAHARPRQKEGGEKSGQRQRGWRMHTAYKRERRRSVATYYQSWWVLFKCWQLFCDLSICLVYLWGKATVFQSQRMTFLSPVTVMLWQRTACFEWQRLSKKREKAELKWDEKRKKGIEIELGAAGIRGRGLVGSKQRVTNTMQSARVSMVPMCVWERESESELGATQQWLSNRQWQQRGSCSLCVCFLFQCTLVTLISCCQTLMQWPNCKLANVDYQKKTNLGLCLLLPL